MDLKSRENKKKSVRRFRKSFSYALDGIKYAFKYEQNLLVHLLTTIVVIITAYILEVSLIEWLILILVMSLVIAFELINSAIEATIDLFIEDYHILAKVGKDCSSGAVLVMAIGAVIIGVIIFLPKLIELV